MTDRELMQQALEALDGIHPGNMTPMAEEYWSKAITALRTAIEQAEKQEPVAWTEREKELIDGMIEVQLDHARRCDNIANRTMAEKQKNWDMERVTLLQKIKATSPAAQRQPLTEEEVLRLWAGDVSRPVLGKNKVLAFARAIEAAHGIKEKNT